MRYKTLSMKEAKYVNKCDGDCVYGYVGEHSYHCKHCLGMKNVDDCPVKFIKVGDTGSEFDHATIVPTHVWKYIRFLCDKGGKKVWIN